MNTDTSKKECIICLDNDNLSTFKHQCGEHSIHNSCLYDWLVENDDQCFFCRNKLIKNMFTLSNHNGDYEFKLPSEIMLEINEEEILDRNNSSSSNSSNSSNSNDSSYSSYNDLDERDLNIIIRENNRNCIDFPKCYIIFGFLLMILFGYLYLSQKK